MWYLLPALFLLARKWPFDLSTIRKTRSQATTNLSKNARNACGICSQLCFCLQGHDLLICQPFAKHAAKQQQKSSKNALDACGICLQALFLLTRKWFLDLSTIHKTRSQATAKIIKTCAKRMWYLLRDPPKSGWDPHLPPPPNPHHPAWIRPFA